MALGLNFAFLTTFFGNLVVVLLQLYLLFSKTSLVGPVFAEYQWKFIVRILKVNSYQSMLNMHAALQLSDLIQFILLPMLSNKKNHYPAYESA